MLSGHVHVQPQESIHLLEMVPDQFDFILMTKPTWQGRFQNAWTFGCHFSNQGSFAAIERRQFRLFLFYQRAVLLPGLQFLYMNSWNHMHKSSETESGATMAWHIQRVLISNNWGRTPRLNIWIISLCLVLGINFAFETQNKASVQIWLKVSSALACSLVFSSVFILLSILKAPWLILAVYFSLTFGQE